MPDDLKTIELLMDGKLPWKDVKNILSSFKDRDRFKKYLQILQSRVSWTEKILLPYGLHLYIVEKDDGTKVVKCDCGHEFGNYKKNWKLAANIYVRDSLRRVAKLYPRAMSINPDWMELREYYCPGCFTLLEVEAVPPGYPVIFDFQPDIEAFYESWLQ